MGELLFKVVDVSQAIKILKVYSENLERSTETVKLEKASGRYIGKNITANEDVPAFARSTMDGFAVNASATFGASAAMPSYLDYAGEIKMGEAAARKLAPNQACAIATGGMLPPGADAVVMLEDTEWLDENTISVLKPVAPGENIIKKGEDIKKGEKIFPKNHRLRPHDLGALAAIGIDSVEVWKPLRTGIISTGNELVAPGDNVLPGQIRDINSYTLYAMVEKNGGRPKIYGIVRDEFNDLLETVSKALEENDIILLSGGSSVGTRDLTLEVLRKLKGMEVLFHGISVKPGKPAIVAAGNRKIIFGLPGHPVSALVAFKVLVRPVITGELYKEKSRRIRLRAVINRNIPAAPGRESHISVKLLYERDKIIAEPILSKSALISSLIKGDGEIVIPKEKEGIRAGEEVEVELYEGGV